MARGIRSSTHFLESESNFKGHYLLHWCELWMYPQLKLIIFLYIAYWILTSARSFCAANISFALS